MGSNPSEGGFLKKKKDSQPQAQPHGTTVPARKGGLVYRWLVSPLGSFRTLYERGGLPGEPDWGRMGALPVSPITD